MPASLTPESREHLRRVLVEEVLPRFGDGTRAQSAAALALGVDQATISRLVSNGVGGSMKLAESVAKFLNDSTSRVLGLGANEVAVPKLREIPGFQAAMDEANRMVADEYRGRLDRQRLESAADHRMSPPPKRIIPGLLIQLALCLPGDEPGSERRPRRKK